MANARQIPHLHSRTRADGRHGWHWKPSPRLRALGWKNQSLGITPTRRASQAIIAAAIDLNDQVATARGASAQAGGPPVFSFADLADAYRQSPEWADLRDSTRAEYNVRLRQLCTWALDGRLPLLQLEPAMVRDLKAELMAPGKSRHVAAATLRVLRMLLNWACAYDHLAVNPAGNVKISAPKSRSAIILPEQVDAATAAAVEAGLPALADSFQLALWTLQRQSDLLNLNRMAWRAVEDVAPEDAAVLAGRGGRVMGFQLQQSKTDTWVTCPVPPFLHDRVEAAFKRSQWLIPDDHQLDRKCPNYLLQRRTRTVFDTAGLDRFRFQDFRRSGMSMLRNLGVADATPISGHAILGRKSILDTYMPATTRAACAAMATAMRTLDARKTQQAAPDNRY